MPSNKMRMFIAQHPELSPEEIEQERQRRIHHVCTTQEQYNKLHHYNETKYTNQAELF